MKLITIGTDLIAEDLQKTIMPNFEKNKAWPFGGLWACEYPEIGKHDINANPWLLHISESSYMFNQKFSEKASIITIKENAKIIEIKSQEDLLKVYEKYPYQNQNLDNNENIILDFASLSKDYDIITIDYTANLNSQKQWISYSSVITNLDCIESYTPIKIGYTNDEYDKFFFIKKFGENKKVKKQNANLAKLTSFLYEEFIKYLDDNPELLDSNHNEYIVNLFELIYHFITTYNTAYTFNTIEQIIKNDEDYLNNYKINDFLHIIAYNIAAQKINTHHNIIGSR